MKLLICMNSRSSRVLPDAVRNIVKVISLHSSSAGGHGDSAALSTISAKEERQKNSSQGRITAWPTCIRQQIPIWGLQNHRQRTGRRIRNHTNRIIWAQDLCHVHEDLRNPANLKDRRLIFRHFGLCLVLR